jgi:hypothetical protein
MARAGESSEAEPDEGGPQTEGEREKPQAVTAAVEQSPAQNPQAAPIETRTGQQGPEQPAP